MIQTSIYHKLEKLPDNYQQEVMDFINFLENKMNKDIDKVNNKNRGGSGCLRGKIKMAEDFDAPLEDFKEYL